MPAKATGDVRRLSEFLGNPAAQQGAGPDRDSAALHSGRWAYRSSDILSDELGRQMELTGQRTLGVGRVRVVDSARAHLILSL